MTVRVRFAPSPTGYLHIGGARTALYSYLFAMRHKGVLILRIEDTDRDRSKKEYEDSLIADLDWLGIKFQEGPFRQSERNSIYQKYADELVRSAKAYPCWKRQMSSGTRSTLDSPW